VTRILLWQSSTLPLPLLRFVTVTVTTSSMLPTNVKCHSKRYRPVTQNTRRLCWCKAAVYLHGWNKVLSVWTVIHRVSKNVPPLSCYNFDTCERILIVFGRNVTDKVSNLVTNAFSLGLLWGVVQEKGSRERCSSWTVLHAQRTSARFSVFPLSQGNAEALDRWGGKTVRHLPKLSQSDHVCQDYSKSQVGRFFETRCI